MEPERIARSNAEDAYQAIRRLIVTVEMPPGTAFTENEMVRRLGFGKTPTREALLRLKLEKLVAVQARSGYRVAPVTLKDVRDTCRLLGCLEAQAAEQAAADPMATARLDPLSAQLERASATDESGDTNDGWIRADWLFHLEFARLQDNQLQTEIMTRLNQLMLRFRYLALALGVPGRLLAHGHDALVESARNSDAAGASAATADCWRETETGLVSVLTATDSMQSTNVWSVRDRNSFYLDAVPPGPAITDVFEPKLPADHKAKPKAEGVKSNPRQ
jgi:DNA-binding GntR family transcriptional regulator